MLNFIGPQVSRVTVFSVGHQDWVSMKPDLKAHCSTFKEPQCPRQRGLPEKQHGVKGRPPLRVTGVGSMAKSSAFSL